MKTQVNDFVLDSEGYCFLCLDKISSARKFSLKESQSVRSLQFLSRFLKLDMRKVFNGKGPISSELLEKVQNSKLKVELCEDCTSINELFLRLYRKLEKVEMEVTSCVDLIKDKLVKAKNAGKMANISKSVSAAKLEYNQFTLESLDGKLGVVEALRNEAILKCSGKLKLSTASPKVKVQKLTTVDIRSENLKLRREFRNNGRGIEVQGSCSMGASINVKFESQNLDENEIYDDGDGGQSYLDNCEVPDPQSDISLGAKSSHELNDAVVTPATSANYVQGGEKPQISIRTQSGRFKCCLCSKEFASSGAVFNHYKTVHLKIRFKCQLCEKLFTQKNDLKLHQQSVHLKQRFTCKYCSKLFSTLKILRNHLMTKCASKIESL